MKKILTSLFVILFVLTGCGGHNQDQQVKDQAIQAYVSAANNMVDSIVKVELSANLNVPRSMLVQDEINMSIDLNGHVDLAHQLMHFAGTIHSTSEGMENVVFEVYIDSQYTYVYTDGQWFKTVNDSVDMASFNQSMNTLTIEQTTEMFDQMRNISYTQATRDGVQGYIISGTIDKGILEGLLQNALSHLTPEQTQGIDLSQLNLDMISQLDINTNTFVAGDHSFIEVFDSSVNVNVMMVGANISDIHVKTAQSNEPVVIPQAALNAPILQAPALPGGSN